MALREMEPPRRSGGANPLGRRAAFAIGASMHLLWDPEHPPVEPPAGADPLIWRLSISLRDDHAKVDADGFCATCREFSPCPMLGTAVEGLVLACALRPPPV